MERVKRIKKKYTAEEKIKYIKEYEEGRLSQWEICRKYGLANSTFRKWLELYKENGEEHFKTEHRGRKGGNPYAALKTSKNLTREERLELENLKLRIENERLKKGYQVKGVGANKEFVTTKDVNMK